MSSSKQPAWWFFWLVITPHMLQSMLWASMAFSEGNASYVGLTAIITLPMSQIWMQAIIPRGSIYETVTFQDKKEQVRRFPQSGIRVCIITFIIFEIVLLIFGAFMHTQLKYVFPVLHGCSLYYLILGILNVVRYEEIQYDVAYYAARAVLDRFNYESRLGFITGRDARGGVTYPLLDILIWIAGALVYWGIHKLLS